MATITVPKPLFERIPPRFWTWAHLVPGSRWGIHLPPHARYEERARAEETLVQLLLELAPSKTRQRVLARLGLEAVAAQLAKEAA